MGEGVGYNLKLVGKGRSLSKVTFEQRLEGGGKGVDRYIFGQSNSGHRKH